MSETENNTGLTLQPKEITLNRVEIAQTMGEIAFKSGIFKAPKAEAAAMIMLKGYELGFPMTAAAEFITVIQNSVELSPRGALAIMHSHPDIIRSVELTDLEKDGKYYGCRCTIVRRKNGKDAVYTKTFTLDDARQAQLTRDDSGWEKYPQQMCQWRALGFCADIACPDLLAGMTLGLKMPEAMTEEDLTYTERTTEKPKVEVLDPKPEVTLADLMARYDGADIVAANGGIIPKTNEECAKIAEILEGAK